MAQAPFILIFRTEDEKIRQICSAYWDMGQTSSFLWTVDEVASKNGMTSVQVQRVVAAACEAHSTERACVACGVMQIYKNRTEFSRCQTSTATFTCSRCKDEVERKAREQAILLEQDRRQIVRARYALTLFDAPPVPVQQMTLAESLFTLALLRTGASEDFCQIEPLEKLQAALTPAGRFDIEVVKMLHAHGIIAPHPMSPTSSFVWDGDGQPSKFYLTKVKWAMLGHLSLREAYQELEVRIEDGPRNSDEWTQALGVALQVGLGESLEYLIHCLDRHRLPFEPGDKTKEVISSVLQKFSIGQVFNFIWLAARDAAAYYMREGVPKQQAANSVVKRIQSAAERAIAERWQVKSYRRVPDCPRSMLSEVTFGKLLGLGERYLEVRLSDLYSPAAEDPAPDEGNSPEGVRPD